MDYNRLNCFTTYHSKKDHHEDVLTRAFLILVRMLPEVHLGFLKLIQDRMSPIHAERFLTSPEDLIKMDRQIVDTQKGHLPNKVNSLISVLMTDEPLNHSILVKAGNREPRYDGLLFYGENTGVIIENKPFNKDVWPKQLSPNIKGVKIAEDGICPYAIVVMWQDAISMVKKVMENEGDGIVRSLMEDFLKFVFKEFVKLNPYDTLTLCKGDPVLIEKRCEMILRKLAPDRTRWHPGWKWCVGFGKNESANEVALYYEENNNSLIVSLHPGDTIFQARKFYNNVNSKKFLNLVAAGWKISPNLHLGFMQPNVLYMTNTASIEDYLDYWKFGNGRNLIKAIPANTWEECQHVIEEWLENGFMSNDDLHGFQVEFIDKARTRAYVRPGFHLTWAIDLEDAEKLDEEGEFVRIVGKKFIEATVTWEQEIKLEGIG